MDYERIEKRTHQGTGGLSPGKLRSMLLGIEKKRKEEELESIYSLRSQVSEIDDSGGSCSMNCKDVDVVSVIPQCSNSTSANKDHSFANSRISSQGDNCLDYDSGYDNMSAISPAFEFQKTDRASQRVPLGHSTKPAPSKWDDAQKWIASPTSNRPKSGQSQGQSGSRKTSNFGHISRQPSMKVVVEVPDQRFVPFEEPDTKRMDSSHVMKESCYKTVTWEAEPYPLPDSSCGKAVVMIENCVGESAINLSRHDSSASVHSATTFIPPPSTARSVSMRDMGTEMTPIASQEPSRNGTPVRATTPTRSPTSSNPSTPQRTATASSTTNPSNDPLNLNNGELSEKELQLKTRREIMALGTQLGKMNIAAWASKEDQDKNACTSPQSLGLERDSKSVIEKRAVAWEEAEKAKYMARFKREEIKIQAWENHQNAKTEAEMRRIEVEVEKMRGQAQDRLMNKLAAVRHKAEEKRAAAESKRNRQATKTEQQADYIRRTGRIPSTFFSCGWCR